MQKYFSRIDFKQVFFIGVFVVLALMLLNLSTRITEFQSVSKQKVKMQTEVARLGKTRDVLQTDLAFTTSEAAVDEWARSEGYLVQPGDIRIIPLVPDNATSVPTKAVVPTPGAIEKWEVWYALFLAE